MSHTEAEAARFGREHVPRAQPSLPSSSASRAARGAGTVSGRAQLWMGMKNILFVRINSESVLLAKALSASSFVSRKGQNCLGKELNLGGR